MMKKNHRCMTMNLLYLYPLFIMKSMTLTKSNFLSILSSLNTFSLTLEIFLKMLKTPHPQSFFPLFLFLDKLLQLALLKMTLLKGIPKNQKNIINYYHNYIFKTNKLTIKIFTTNKLTIKNFTTIRFSLYIIILFLFIFLRIFLFKCLFIYIY